jgi:hypothetical protein
MNSEVSFWPRTTYVGGLTKPDDVIAIAENLKQLGYEGDYLVQNFKKSSGTRNHEVAEFHEPEISEIESVIDQIPNGINLKLEWR